MAIIPQIYGGTCGESILIQAIWVVQFSSVIKMLVFIRSLTQTLLSADFLLINHDYTPILISRGPITIMYVLNSLTNYSM